MKKIILILAATMSLVACATKPKLYPNAKFEAVGPQAAQQDIDNCMAKADAYLESEKGKQVLRGAGTGAAGGAAMGAIVGGIFGGGRGLVRGAVGGGVVGGAAGAVGGALSPDQLKQRYVNKCLADQGYEVIGWN